ncbi:MAG: ABC transporter permease [Polaromonas sp.]
MLDGYVGQILRGLLTTLELGLVSLVVATTIGFYAALMALSENAVLKWLTGVYSSMIRGIPDMLLMLMLFYGGQIFLNQVIEWSGAKARIELDQFTAGIVTLGIIYGAYFMETFRGALMAIAPGQKEAAQAFGMSRRQINLRILFPQMIRFALPGITNNWLVMSKATALVSVIGLQDMMYRAKQAGAASHEPFTWLLFTGALYLAITSVSLFLLRLVERKYSVGVRYGSHV